ncbi:MAG: hypothetical protein AB7V16_11670 [Vulcanibacillus sp.]
MECNNGMLVYIDDKYNVEKECIELIKSMNESQYLHMVFKEIPPNDFFQKNRYTISMVIMDWVLWEEKNEFESEKEKLEYKLKVEKLIDSNIDFISYIISNNLPIIIFARQDETNLKKVIEEKNKTLKDKMQSLLHISNKKSDLKNVINEWYNKMPSVKIFDYINQEIQRAKIDFFADMIISNNTWIKSLWCSIRDEKNINPEMKEEKNRLSEVSIEFAHFIFNGIKNRMGNITEFAKEDYLKVIDGLNESDINDYKRLLENSRYIPDEKIDKNSVMSGDLYSNGEKYCINVRADCDTARINGDVTVYVVSGKSITEIDFLNKKICSKCCTEHEHPSPFLGNYLELLYNDVNVTIPYIAGQKIIQFNLKDLDVVKYDVSTKSFEKVNGENKYKYSRIGRVLPPYSQKVQQRFSQYMTRLGLDSIPKSFITK